MPEGFPHHDFFAEILHDLLSVRERVGNEHDQKPTLISFCKSLFEYILNTFMATSRPQCSPFQTSANPPPHKATPALSYQT